MAENQPIISPSEEWRPVIGYEGRYEVSSLGRVRSLSRTVEHKDGTRSRRAGRILSPGHRSNGYLHVNLYYGHKRSKSIYVHTLVLEAFVGPRPSPEMVARHLDDNSTRNHVDNLAWGSESENQYDKVRNGNHHYAKRDTCKWGHEYTPENTYIRERGKCKTRVCKTCETVNHRKYAARRAELRSSRSK